MGLSTFMGLETSLRGLLAQQQALNTTSHNIANASTTGYSRQVAVFQASPAYTMPGVTTAPAGPGQIGTGVDVASYQRIRDAFLDVQYRAQSMLQGQAQANQDGLQQVQLAFNEPTDSGISSLLANYWGAWQNLSNNPEDMGTRQALAQSAASLADGFQSLSSQLTTLQSQTAQNVTDQINQVNNLGTQSTNGGPQANHFSVWSGVDSVSYTRGSHLFKFGGDIHDRWGTYIGRVPGYVLQANYLEALLDGRAYRPVSLFYQLLISAVWFAVVELPFWFHKFSSFGALMRSFALSLLIMFVLYYLLLVNFGWYVSVAPPSALAITGRVLYQAMEGR